MSRVLMYATDWCPYCQRAEQLLRSKGVAEIDKVLVDIEPGRREEMMKKTGRRTVPQIYIGDTHVGGYDDLAALDRAGRLMAMLDASGGEVRHGDEAQGASG
ncbi:MAG: glutaredoxin 3 [Betaproteobacteria bacterium]|nr:glutaredoxin 3 [Betaproteobacteria bacterium]